MSPDIIIITLLLLLSPLGALILRRHNTFIITISMTIMLLIVQHGFAQLALALAEVEDVFIHCALGIQLVHCHCSGLADPVTAVLRDMIDGSSSSVIDRSSSTDHHHH